MFDLGWTELLVIGIVALIVVGPKDLPVLFRNVGRFVGKARGMAREFSTAMNEAADEAGVNEIKKGLNAATNPVSTAMDGINEAARDVAKSIDPTKFDPDSETGKLAGIIGLWLGHRNARGFAAIREVIEDLQTIMIGPAWLLSVIYRRLRVPY